MPKEIQFASLECYQKEDEHRTRRRLLEGLFDRRERRSQSQKESNMFENEGGIESIKKPNGFGASKTDDEFGHYVESSNGKAKICYWKRNDYSPEADSAKRINEILKKGAHAISDDERDAVYDCLMPGRWSKGAPFDVGAMSVKQIGGKNVLSIDVDFQSGKRTTLIVFNPDATNKTLEHLWVESNSKTERERVEKVVLSGIKWKK